MMPETGSREGGVIEGAKVEVKLGRGLRRDSGQ